MIDLSRRKRIPIRLNGLHFLFFLPLRSLRLSVQFASIGAAVTGRYRNRTEEKLNAETQRTQRKKEEKKSRTD